MSYSIVKANVVDADLLSDIAMRSKSYWGYDNEFMQAAKKELTVTAVQLTSSDYIYRCIVDYEQQICGFYCLNLLPDMKDLARYKVNQRSLNELFKDNKMIELEALFVLPNKIGKGLGRQLFDHATEFACSEKYSTLLVQSDPNALDFYQRLGCKQIGEQESGSIAGRFLPLLSFKLSQR